MSAPTLDNTFQARRIAQLQAQNAQSLQSAGGGGTFDGMQERVALLEKRFDRVETKLDSVSDKVSELRVDMGVLRERIAHLPSKGWAVTIALTTIGALATVITIAPKLQQFFGVASP